MTATADRKPRHNRKKTSPCAACRGSLQRWWPWENGKTSFRDMERIQQGADFSVSLDQGHHDLDQPVLRKPRYLGETAANIEICCCIAVKTDRDRQWFHTVLYKYEVPGPRATHDHGGTSFLLSLSRRWTSHSDVNFMVSSIDNLEQSA